MDTKPSHTNSDNPVAALRRYGQSVWLDYLRRSLIESGELARLIREDGLGGITSNPAIFQKAIEGDEGYAADIATAIAKDRGLSPKRVFELLAVRDIQSAADALAAVYHSSAGMNGYVSLEVSPDLAHDAHGSIEEARRLWREVDRPNLMIKIPGTAEGLPVIATLLGEGINVNITLLFARSVYERVAEIYIEALEKRAARGESVERVASVASFFVSRIDTAVDAAIEQKLKDGGAERAPLESLLGKVAIANAKLAYLSYRRIFTGARWQALMAKGARPQRVLWASTGVKNPRYRDVMYVEELIGPETVNTLPPETLDAFRDHGKHRPSLLAGVEEASQTLDALQKTGISLDKITDELVVDGVNKFVEPYQKLLATVERRARGK
ncbi:MAG TPA: transaldolase [Polyangiaceae bacterium]|nr:transaldolase [Polyangiaceae bacterium]